MSSCGDLTSWSFRYTTDHLEGFDWYAEGDLPIGIGTCVEAGVNNTGGVDGCKDSTGDLGGWYF